MLLKKIAIGDHKFSKLNSINFIDFINLKQYIYNVGKKPCEGRDGKSLQNSTGKTSSLNAQNCAKVSKKDKMCTQKRKNV